MNAVSVFIVLIVVLWLIKTGRLSNLYYSLTR